MKIKRILGIVITVMLVMTMFAPAAFAATDEPTQEPTETTQPTNEPTQEPTPTPTPTQKPTATPTPTQKPTQTPTQEPTQEPTQTPTQAPSEDSGNETVNVTLYVYSGGAAASGYTVKLDTVSQKTNKEGMVSYPDVTVEDHKITITNPEGKQSVGMMYLSRGNSTEIQNVAMGGKYEISVANGAHNLYASVVFVADEAIEITSVGESKTPAPVATATASTSPVGAMKITADFVDSAGKPVTGLGIGVSQDGGTPVMGMVDSKGRFVLNQGGLGNFLWGILPANMSEDQAISVDTEIQQGATTKIVSSDGSSYVVQTPGTTKELYMKFEQSGNGYVLKEVLDKVPGGIDSLTLGIIMFIVIIVVVIVILVVVRHNRKKKRAAQKSADEPRGREREFELEKEDEPFAEAPRPKQTGGANKMGDRSRM